MAIYDLQSRLCVSVKDFGAVGDGVADDTAEIQAALDSDAPVVFFPAGTYKIATGSSITLGADQTLYGEGTQRTYITCSNAYAFKAPATGPLDRVEIRHMNISLRSGSTSGGAVQAKSDSYHSAWVLENLHGGGVTTANSNIFDLHGFIGSYLYRVNAQGGYHGIYLGTDGFPSNASTIRDSRAVLNRGVGIVFDGGGGNRLLDSTVETNSGHGVQITGCTAAIVANCWFEDNGLTHVNVTGSANHSKILRNKFHYHQGGSTSPHIYLSGPTSPATMDGVQITDNFFQDAPGNAYNVQITAQCAGTLLAGNFWYNSGTPYDDGGTGTRTINNYSGGGFTANRIGGPWEAEYEPVAGTQHPGPFYGRRRSGQTTSLLLLETEAGADLLEINSSGQIVSYQALGMRRDVATANLAFSGGTAANLGGNVVLYGESHSSEAGKGILRSAGTNRMQWNATGIGFYTTAPVAKPTGVAVTAAGIHAALVTLGLISA